MVVLLNIDSKLPYGTVFNYGTSFIIFILYIITLLYHKIVSCFQLTIALCKLPFSLSFIRSLLSNRIKFKRSTSEKTKTSILRATNDFERTLNASDSQSRFTFIPSLMVRLRLCIIITFRKVKKQCKSLILSRNFPGSSSVHKG